MMAGIAANGVSSISEAGIRFGWRRLKLDGAIGHEEGYCTCAGSSRVTVYCILSTASRTEDARRLWTSMATTTGVGESRQGLLSHRQP